jgi:hypothetical protein
MPKDRAIEIPIIINLIPRVRVEPLPLSPRREHHGRDSACKLPARSKRPENQLIS